MKLFVFSVIFFALSSCNQNKKLEENLGDKISVDQYEKAVVETWGDDNILTTKKDDYAYVEKSISLNYGPMRKTFGKSMTITEVIDKTNVIEHHMVIQSEEIQDGTQSKLSSRERIFAVKKSTTQTKNVAESNVNQQAQKDSDINVGQLSIEDEIQATPFEGFLDVLGLCRIATVECFKLKVENLSEPVPEEIKAKSCRFFPDCQWSGKKVSFVIRVSYKDAGSDVVKTQNNIISFKIVNEMPYLFKMVEYCFEGLSEYKGQKFPVKICTQVKDTIKGQ